MARDSAGTYTPPSNSFNPAVEGSEIDEGDWNATLSDLASALTDSVDKTGKGTITAHLELQEISTPSTPASGKSRLYLKDVSGVSSLMILDDAGTEVNLMNAALADNTVTFAKMQDIATDRLIGRDSSLTGNPEEIAVTGGLEFSGSQSIRIADAGVTNAKLANMANATFKGRVTSGSGVPEDLTATQATSLLNAFTGDSGSGGVKGLVPAPSAGDTAAGAFLFADGTWQVPSGGSGGGDVSAAANFGTDNRLLRSDGVLKGAQASGITVDDSDNVSGVVALSATTIEIGHASDTTLSRSSAGNVAIEGNIVYRAGGTDVALADGGTGASLSDPGADRIMFWDDSAGQVTWLEVGTGLSITSTTLSATATGLTLVAEQATTSGTAIDFTSIPSGVKQINVMFDGFSTNSTAVTLIQIGDSGGVESTGYTSVGGTATASAMAAASQTTGFAVGHNNAAAATISGRITLTLQEASSNTWVASGSCCRGDAVVMYFCSGIKALSAELDRVRVTTVSAGGTFDAGAVSISYL